MFNGLKKDDKFLKEFFRCTELVQLIKDVLTDTAMLVKKPDWKEDWSKVENHGFPNPGARVIIYWADEHELEPDHGYIFTLPISDSDDIFMSGIVHIPDPNGCEKCKCDPEWHLLSKLTSNKQIKKIVIE